MQNVHVVHICLNIQISNEAAFGNSWVVGNDPDCVPQQDEVNPCLEVSDAETVDIGRQRCDIIQAVDGEIGGVGRRGM